MGDLENGTEGQEISEELGNQSNDTQEFNQEFTQENNQNEGNERGLHPSWNPLLEQLPEAFHKGISPILSGVDDKYRSLKEQYSPYQEFVNSKADPEILRAGMNLAQALNSDPQGLMLALNEKYGFLEIEDDDEDEYDPSVGEDDDFEDEDDPIASHPLFQEMSAKLAAFEEAKQAQEMEQTQAEVEKQINADIASIRQRLAGDLNDTQFAIIRDSAIQSHGGSLAAAADALFKAGLLPEKKAPETHNGNGFPNPPRFKLDGSNDRSEIEQLLLNAGLGR